MKKLLLGLAVTSFIFTACNKEPELSISAPSEATVGKSVSFENGGDIKKAYNVAWNFGDGGVANTWNSSHVYQEAGTYTVTLSATSKKGNKAASTTATITVKDDAYGTAVTRLEDHEAALDAKYAMLEGTWSFSSSKFTVTFCNKNNTPSSAVGNSSAKSMKFTINAKGEGYVVNANGVKSNFGIELIDDTHANISSFEVPFGDTQGNTTSFPGGVYEIALTSSSLTLTKVNEQLSTDGGTPPKACYDTWSYTASLTK